MGVDYGEKICQAIDEIVTAKLEGLQYDITKLCTIVDDSYSYQGKYIVSDGTARYDAFTTDVSLKKGNQVQVTIPNGDYTMQKTIIGRVATTDTTPFNYVSPLDTMIKITNNVFDNARTVYGDNAGLLANGETMLIGPIYSLEGQTTLNGYSRLGLSANFRSWLSDLDVVSGSYGIKILIYTNQVVKASDQASTVVYELNFDTEDMIGNPYQFEDYFYQEKCFDVSNISNINKLEVYFYQNGNFKNGEGKEVSSTIKNIIDGVETEAKKPNNLFVNNVKIFLGYEIGAFTDETLMLYTPNVLTYRYDKEEVKEIYLRWIHKLSENEFELLNKNNFDNEKYEVRWYKYNPGYELIDQYAGKDWERLDNDNQFYLYFAPEVKNQTEEIKVITLIKGIVTDKGMETATPYTSNILVFENEVLVPDQTTLKAATALSIRCQDNSEGNYLLYDQNGKLNNEGEGKGYTRYFEVLYEGASIQDSIGTIDWIKWYFPKNEATMLVTTQSMYKENDGKVSEEILSYKGVDYIEIIREEKDNQIPKIVQAYAIDNYWTANKGNNTVICKAKINGVEYEALEELHFGKAGTNGTNMTFYIEFEGNTNALTLNTNSDNKSTVIVWPRLYSNTSERVLSLPAGSSIEWSWYSSTPGKNYIALDDSLNEYAVLTCNVSTMAQPQPIDNYYILKATLTLSGDGQKLEAYLPVPIKSPECVYMEGAREIIYDYQGNPNYYDQPYIAYYGEKNAETSRYQEAVNWAINYANKNNRTLANGYLPQLKTLYKKNGLEYKALSAPSFYLAGYNDQICVSCEGYWYQPLLVMQSRYDLAMLNEWDGKLSINDNNGTILSTMLGAGRKTENNTFSGVLIGDVKTGTDKNDFETLTGVYGLSDGVISYAFKEDGSATIGKKGKGQILIDGNSSIIKSGNYVKSQINDGKEEVIETVGLEMNLSDGNLTAYDEIGNPKVILSAKYSKDKDAYFKVYGKANNELIKIDDEDYFLHSANYLLNQKKEQISGTSLDLKTGSFISTNKNLSGSIYITPNEDKGSLFQIIDKRNNILLDVGTENYYLQSADYTGTYQKVTKIDDNDAYVYFYENNQSYEINDNCVIQLNDLIYIVWNEKNKISQSDFYRKVNDTYQIINFIPITLKDVSGKEYVMSADEVKERFLNLLSPITDIDDEKKKGIYLDLNNGKIKGYNLYLEGINSEDPSEKITIDTTSKTTPLSIGSNFKVNWDGSITCLKIAELSTKGYSTKGNYITIGNNFSINANGGSGTFNGGGTFTGNLSSGIIRGATYSPKEITFGNGTFTVLTK